ncbi:MAG: outer membrane beta-barrel protein [Reichenbachiella sp.]
MKDRMVYLASLISILFMANSAYSQKAIGLYVGSVTNQFEGDRVKKLFDVGFRMHSSMSVGLVLDIPIKEDVYLTAIPGYKNIAGTVYEENEEYYDQIDQGIEEPSVPRLVDISVLEFDYFALPILLKLISDNKRWQFMAGIESAFNLKSNLNELKTGEDIDIGSYITNINYSAIFGLGYIFKIKKSRFSIDLMYTQGLVNMSSGLELPFGNVPRVKSTTGETKLTWFFLSKTENTK